MNIEEIIKALGINSNDVSLIIPAINALRAKAQTIMGLSSGTREFFNIETINDHSGIVFFSFSLNDPETKHVVRFIGEVTVQVIPPKPETPA